MIKASVKHQLDTGWTRTLDAVHIALRDKLLFDAAKAGGEVYRKGYITAIPRFLPVGTYRDANGAVHAFQQLFKAVVRKTVMFRDMRGAYSIIGGKTVTPGRDAAPQAEWIEEGTEERFTKDGSSRGKVTASHILARVAVDYEAAAKQAAVLVITTGLKSVVGN